MLILQFQTQQDAQSCLNTINLMAATWWQSQGYTVVDGKLISKFGDTGQDDYEAAAADTWAEIQESPDNTWYFTSLSNDPRFPDWKETYAQMQGVAYEEIEMPDEWIETEE